MALVSKMTCLLLRLIILIIVVHICGGILPEYYFDTEEEVDDNKTEAFKSDDQNESVSKKYNSNIDTHIYNSKNEQTKYNNDTDLRRVQAADSDIKVTSLGTMKLKNKTSNKMFLSNLITFDTLDYADDITRSYQRLRAENSTDVDFENNTEIITKFTEEDENVTYNNSIKYLADFFNLDPAISKLEVKDTFLKQYKGSEYIWYIPEKYPCWDLPVVVGKLGKRKVLADVFRVYYGKLTDVKLVGEPEPETPLRYSVPNHRKRANKWCNDAPCFGDHSLCIFSDKSLSKICDDGYRVMKPSKLEKISMINTINAMRNSIASGSVDGYRHLPPAADMRQMLYDTDLEEMAEAWLRQCLPGIDPCSSLENEYVTQLECTKSAEHCCYKFLGAESGTDCIPMYECFIFPVVGCLHAWFAAAGRKLTATDVECGHANPETFNTVQLIWSKSVEMGCAYGERTNGDIRIVCNFAPGAPFFLQNKYFCGLIEHRDITNVLIIDNDTEVTDLKFLSSLGIILTQVHNINDNTSADEIIEYFYPNLSRALRTSDLDGLNNIYEPGWARDAKKDHSNGTMGMVARLVTKYIFIEEGMSKCDLDEPIYRTGEPGSLCIERGMRYCNLCFDFADTSPGYRLSAILAAIALFSLILYDLFSGVMRQTNY